jgi:hypothetical protein
MAYIGREPQVGNFQVCDAISVVNGQAAYTMQVSSVNVSPETANHMIVSLNGIIQAPGSSYTVSGSTITFASNLVTGDVIDFIHILGSVLDLGVPSDSTVSLAKLTATGTKDATTFLRGDNTFAAAGGGKVLQVLNATDSTQRSTTSTSYATNSNTLAIDITPSATSSKILVFSATSIFTQKSGGHGGYFTIYRDSTNLMTGGSNDGMGTVGLYIPSSTSGYTFNSSAMQVLDSPNTTSQVTYQVYFKQESGHGGEIRLNPNGLQSSITAMEIGA